MAKQKWYKKATVQAAISGGVFVVLGAVITGIFLLASDRRDTFTDAISDIKSSESITIIYNPQSCTFTTNKLLDKGASSDDRLSVLTRNISIEFVEGLVDSKYRWRGTTPEMGFDTSSFVQYIYGQMGIFIPGTTREQRDYGQSVSLEQLAPGDLLFFALTDREVADHVAFYLGENEFIHAARPHVGVRKDSLDKPFWTESLVLARRICVSDSDH